MKKMMNLIHGSKLSSFFQVFSLTNQKPGSLWQLASKDAKRFIGLCLRALPMIVGSSKLSFVKACFLFTRMLVHLSRRQGFKGAAKYFKASTLLLMKYTGEDHLVDTMKAGHCVSITRRGLPRIIPVQHRRRIDQGHGLIIHFYLSLFSIYRVLGYKGTASISTIVTPGAVIPELWSKEFLEFLDHFFVMLRDIARYRALNSFSRGLPKVLSTRAPMWKASWLLLLRGGPNSTFSEVAKGPGCSIGNLFVDALAWTTRPKEFELLQEWCKLTTNERWLLWSVPLRAVMDTKFILWNVRWISELTNTIAGTNHPLVKPRKGQRIGWLGRLAFLEEPGKWRVVALLDYYTQVLMYPIHREIFEKLLQKIPQDGTYDQHKPIRALQRLAVSGDRKFFSFDLSAATDRLPVVIQEEVLSFLIGKPLANLWRRLLTERDYSCPRKVDNVRLPVGKFGVRYAVGQPMGAYSSWAMLALTHHAIVQYASWKAGKRSWFEHYALLGDDVVIADTRVAHAYLEVMRLLGVEISFAKSLSSKNGSFEFAKRFVYKGKDVSPTTLKHLGVAMTGIMFIPELASSVKKILPNLSLPMVLKFAGLGFRTQSGAYNKPLASTRRFLGLMLLLSMPHGPFPVASLLEWVSQLTHGTSRVIPEVAVPEIFHKVFMVVSKRLSQDIEKDLVALENELSADSDLGLLRDTEHYPWFKFEILGLLSPVRERYEVCQQLAAKLWILGGERPLNLSAMLEIVEKYFLEVSLIPKSIFHDEEAKARSSVGIWIKMWTLVYRALLDLEEAQRHTEVGDRTPDVPSWHKFRP